MVDINYNFLDDGQQLYKFYPQVCVTHGMDWTPNKLSSMNLLNAFFAKLAAVMSQNMVRYKGPAFSCPLPLMHQAVPKWKKSQPGNNSCCSKRSFI